jgi:hypothetical protein
MEEESIILSPIHIEDNKSLNEKNEQIKKNILQSIDELKNQRGNLCLCKNSFESKDREHLSFVADEVLSILEMENEEFWFAINTKGNKGYISNKNVLLLTHILNDGGGLEEIIDFYLQNKHLNQDFYYLFGK